MNGEAKYRQIASALRLEISSGRLQPGEPLPTEAELVELHQVARMTVRQALELLESEGLIEGERPRRVAVRDRLAVSLTRDADRVAEGEQPTRGADAFLGDAATAGREPGQEILVIHARASAEVARHLCVGEGSPVTARQLVRSAGRTRHNKITFWFPHDVARGTPLDDPGSIEEGSLAWLEKRYGTLAHEPAEISTRMPTPEEAELLDIPQGVPVMEVWRTTVMQGGLPVVTSVSLFPGDRTVLRTEV
jgi:GntR family transcriptional regulator